MARILLVDDNADLGALVAGALADRGHAVSVHILGADALAAARTTELQAAVVDLHLPDVQGTEILAALRDRGVPSIAISGVFRGEGIADKLMREFGARQLVEKPFELHALVEAVEACLTEDERPRTSPEVPELVLSEAIEVEADAFAAAPARAAMSLGDLPFSGRNVWDNAAPARPSTGQLRALASLGPEAQPLSGTSVPRLLGAAHQSGATGELRLRRGPIVKVIWLDAGRPVFAASNVAAERFGRHAVQKGALSADDLATVAELANREKVKTGEAMVRLGLITADARAALLHDQALQIMSSTFDWPDGEYRFIHRPVGKPHVLPLELDLPEVLLRGFARLPLVRLRKRVPIEMVPSPAPDPVFELHALKLDPPQARLVLAADGTKRVDDLLAVSELEERDALALLLALLELRVLEPRAATSNRRIVLI